VARQQAAPGSGSELNDPVPPCTAMASGTTCGLGIGKFPFGIGHVVHQMRCGNSAARILNQKTRAVWRRIAVKPKHLYPSRAVGTADRSLPVVVLPMAMLADFATRLAHDRRGWHSSSSWLWCRRRLLLALPSCRNYFLKSLVCHFVLLRSFD
jgi:hypothetical protein